MGEASQPLICGQLRRLQSCRTSFLFTAIRNVQRNQMNEYALPMVIVLWQIRIALFSSMHIDHNRHDMAADEPHIYDEHACIFPCHRIILSSKESSNASRCRSDRLPADCWRACLKYLSSPRDLGRFRLISKQHNQMQDEKIKLTNTDFHCIFSNYSGRRRYRCNRNFEREIPLIPCGFLTLENEFHYVDYLWRFHVISKQFIVRGLVAYSGLSFLSTFLRHDILENEYILLICICDHDRLEDVRMYWDRELRQHVIFDLPDLRTLLQRDYMIIDGLEDGCAWTMESKWKRCRRIVFQECILLFNDLESTSFCKKFGACVNAYPCQFWTCIGFLSLATIIVFIIALVQIIK